MLVFTIGMLIFNIQNTSKLEFYGPVVIPKEEGMIVHWWTSKREGSVVLVDGERIAGGVDYSSTKTLEPNKAPRKSHFHSTFVNKRNFSFALER